MSLYKTIYIRIIILTSGVFLCLPSLLHASYNPPESRSVADLSDVNSATISEGRLLIADGTEFESMALQGDCTMNGAGYIDCSASAGGTELDNLNDVNSATQGEGRLLISDGTEFESMVLQGDATMNGAGYIRVTEMSDADEDTKVQVEKSADEDIIRFDTGGTERVTIIANGNVGIGTSTPAKKLDVLGTFQAGDDGGGDPVFNVYTGSGSGFARVHNGSNYGFIMFGANNAPTIGSYDGANGQLRIGGFSSTTDTTPSTVASFRFDTSRLGIGTTAPATKLDVNGTITATGLSGITIDDLDDVNSATISEGRLLIADGTEFESMALQGDCTMNGAGFIDCSASSGGTELDDLNDVNSATQGEGRLLISDGTEFESMVLQGDATMNGAGYIRVTEMSDADEDTKIQVEESADEDAIRFDTAGTQRMRIHEDGIFISTNGAEQGSLDTSGGHLYVAGNSNLYLRASDASSRGIKFQLTAPTIEIAHFGIDGSYIDLYNTMTDASNYEKMTMGWTSNAFLINSTAAGTGTVREIALMGGNVGVGTSAPAFGLEVNGTAYISNSLEIPNGTAPTVDAAGEIAVDTSDDQLVYYGGAKRVLSYKQHKDVTIEDPQDADNLLLWKSVDPITITDIFCIVDPADTGESVVIDVQERNSTGDSPATVDATITCDNDGAEDDGTLTNGAIDANDWISLDIGTVTGTVTQVSVTIYYTIDAE